MPIVITCTTCGQQAAAPDETAGQMVHCPHCQAVVTVPQQAGAPPVPLELETTPFRQPRRTSAPDRDEAAEEVGRSRPRRRGSTCPFCGSSEPPFPRDEINQTGWILFVVLIIVCTPLCWIPLLTCKDQIRVCPECGHRRG